MTESKKKTLVTGGAGFIGSHVVDALIAAGREVVVVDDLSTGRRENLAHHGDGVDLHVADVSETLELEGAFDSIVHLAAQVSVVRSIDAPLEDLRANTRGTVQVLEFARTKGVRKVVFASSAAVYGDVQQVPTREDAPLSPLSPYGVDKLASEYWLTMYSNVHGISTSALRFFNVYGPRQDPSSAYSGVISIFLERAHRGQDLTIFGDGQQTRDFVYVGDVVRAILAAMELDQATRPLNVGTGERVSVEGLARAVLAAADAKGQIRFEAARAGDIRHSCAIVEALQETLGVRASTSLSDGLRSTADWYRAQAEV